MYRYLNEDSQEGPLVKPVLAQIDGSTQNDDTGDKEGEGQDTRHCPNGSSEGDEPGKKNLHRASQTEEMAKEHEENTQEEVACEQ